MEFNMLLSSNICGSLTVLCTEMRDPAIPSDTINVLHNVTVTEGFSLFDAADPNVVSLIRLLVTMTNNSSNLLQL